MFSSIAHAAQPAASPGGLGSFLPLIVLFGIFYMLLIRPQQKKAKAQRDTIDALKAGDTVITNGGIYGTITKIEDHVISLQCSDKVHIKVIKKAISAKVDPETMEGE